MSQHHSCQHHSYQHARPAGSRPGGDPTPPHPPRSARTALPILDEDQLRAALAVRDLTDPAAGPHAMQLLVEEIVDALDAPSVDRRRDHPVVTLADNYDNLGYPPDAVTRDARYTRYVDPEHVLRSHTSAQVPPALRELAEAPPGPAPTEVLLVAPGICYRRDSIDWQHTGTPHQLDLWWLGRDHLADESGLTRMIDRVVSAALPGAQWRTVPSPHPYTDAGRQVDVLWREQWVEVGECGIAARHVLRTAGLDAAWTGLAMGVGLDRLLMLRKGIPDIRLLRSADPRVTMQLRDLTPYRPVSGLPPVRRDLSVVVAADTDGSDEAVGDRVRVALGALADTAEEVRVLGDTGYDELPPSARERLGIGPGQRNLLVRLVLRPLDRTLTDHEANRLRDRVYGALHEGTVREWAAAD